MTSEELDDVPVLEWAADESASVAIPQINARPPTARQFAVLKFIHEFRSKHGFSPALREIATAIGIRSTNGVNDHLHRLEQRNLIVRRDLLSRSILITASGLVLLGVVEESPAPLGVVEDEAGALRAEVARLNRLLDLAVQSMCVVPAALEHIQRERAR